MSSKLRSRARFWFRRIFRRTFFLGAFRRVREILLVPYVHHLLHRGGAKRGPAFTVLQIGANDGVALDPLSSLVRKYGWSGVLVEPNPQNFERLQQTYRGQPQVRLEQAAITAENGTALLYRPIAMPDGSKNPFFGLDTLGPSHLEKLAWIEEDWQSLVEPVEVATLTLASLCQKHNLLEIDFLLTDTEGHDKVILDQVDFKTLRPRFIQFEYIHIPRKELAELTGRLRRNGYRLIPLRWDIFAYLT